MEGIIYRIVSESLWTKSTDEVTTRKTMLNFEEREPAIIRSSQEEFLSDDVSIMIARNKKTKEHICIVNLLKFTNVIEIYNQKVNFVDFESLNRLTDCI